MTAFWRKVFPFVLILCLSTLNSWINLLAAGSELLVSNGTAILRVNTFTKSKSVIIYQPFGRIVGLAVDLEDDWLFWSDVSKDHRGIYLSRINGSDHRLLIQDVYEVNGLSVNWATDHIYWTDAQQSTINVANYDGTGHHVLIPLGTAHEPRGIIVDPILGYIFWTDQRKGTVERARLNGKDRRVMVDQEVYWPNQLAISRVFRKLYWIEASPNSGIMSCDLDGDNFKMERHLFDVTSGNPSFGLIVIGNKAFVSTWFTNVIYSTLVETPYSVWSKEVTDLGTEELFSLASLDASTQPVSSHPCSGAHHGGCSHLCLPSGWGQHYTCACPSFQGLALGPDNATCQEPDTLFFYTFQESGTVGFTSLMMSTIPQQNIVAISHSPIAVSFHFHEKTIYWSDSDNTIFFTKLGSSQRQIFLNQTNGIGNVIKMAIDQINHYLYYINTGTYGPTNQPWYRIEVLDLRTRYRKLIIEERTPIKDLLLDVENGYMFYQQGEDDLSIIQRSLNRENRKFLNPVGVKNVRLSEVTHDSGSPVLVLFKQRGPTVKKYNIGTDEISKDIATTQERKKMKKEYTDTVIYRSVAQVNNVTNQPCSSAPCSHLCFPSPANESRDYICSCPDMSMMVLSEDGVNCSRPENFLLVADVNRIIMLSLDVRTQNEAKSLYFPHLHSNIVSMVYDEINDILYWTDKDRFKIMSLNLTTMSVRTVHNTDQFLGAINLDSHGQKLYWTSWNRSFSGRINRILLDQGEVSARVLVETDYIPRALTLTPDGRYLYWTEDENRHGSLHMSRSDGFDMKEIDLGNFHLSVSQSLVLIDDVLYISDVNGNVFTYNLNDSSVQTAKFLLEPNQNIFDLKILDNILLFTNDKAGKLQMVSMETGQKLTLEDNLTHPTSIVIHHPLDIQEYDVCKNESNCSHYCIPLPRGQFLCHCPPGYSLHQGHQCEEAMDPWEITSSDMCDDALFSDPFAVCARYISTFIYQIVCVPGFHRNGSFCQACPVDTYLPFHSNDTSCLPCPVTMTTKLSTGATNCTCARQNAEFINGSCIDEIVTLTMKQEEGMTTSQGILHSTNESLDTTGSPVSTEVTEKYTEGNAAEITSEKMLREPNYDQKTWPRFKSCPHNKLLKVNVPEFRNKAKLPVTWTAHDSQGDELQITSNYPIRRGEITLEWISNDDKGKHTIVQEAEDEYGRKARCQFDVQVYDKKPPVFTYCPHDLTFLSQEEEDRVFWLRPEAEDNIRIGQYKASHDPGTIFSRGITMVTYTVADEAGNVAYCNFTVTLSQARKPCTLPTIHNGAFACDRKLGTLEETCFIVCENKYTVNPLKIFSSKFNCEKKAQVDKLKEMLENQKPCLSLRVPSVVTQEFTITFRGQCQSGDLDLQKALSSAVVEYIAARNICPLHKCGYSNITITCDIDEMEMDKKGEELGEKEEGLEKEEEELEYMSRRSLQHVTFFLVKWNVTIDNSTGFYNGQIEAILVNLRLELVKLLQSPLYVGNREYVAMPGIRHSELIWACQDGEISTEHGCVGCPKGTRHDKSTNQCIICPPGTFQPYDSQTNCISCGDDKTSPELAVAESSCKSVAAHLDEMSKFLIISACSFGFVFLVLTLIFYLHYKRQQKRNQDRSSYTGHKYITPNIYVAPPPIPRMQNTKRTSPRNSPLLQRKFSPKPLQKNSPKNSPILSCKSDILRMPSPLSESGTLSSQRFNIYKNHDYEDAGYRTTASNRSNYSTRTNLSGRTDYQNDRGPTSPPASPCSLTSRSQLEARSPTSSRSPFGSRSPLGSPMSERAIYTGDFRNFSPSLQTNSLRTNRERHLYLYDK